MRKGQIEYAPVSKEVESKGGIHELLVNEGLQPGSKRFDRIRKNHANGIERGHANVFHVDEVCCDLLGKHPSELYGQEWFAA